MDSMLKDRGKIKWRGAFFMPEHVKMLKQAQIEDQKVPRPLLDDGQIEEMERLILESFENDLLLEITTWKNGFFTSRVGVVKKIDSIYKKLTFVDELESSCIIDFFNLINVRPKD
jgi:hypothetical protein